jgi:RNA polymerase sigma-70 factor (ECF subfamily)
MLDGEKKLIDRAVKGESSAFGSLYDHYQPHIYRFVFVKVSRREEAEDLTHQVFLQAWQNIQNYRDFGFPFSSWLYRIARNEVIDYYRSKKEHVPLDEVDPEFFAVSGNGPDTAEQNFQMQKVLAVIRTMKPDYQDIIIMRFVEELSLKEVAAALHKSEGAVKLLQHRALRKLETALGTSFRTS